MKSSSLALCLVVAAVISATGCSVSTGHDLPPTWSANLTFTSRVGDKAIDFELPDKEIATFPTWSPDQAQPLSTAAVFAIAMKELPKYSHGSTGWAPREVSLQRITQPENAGPQDRWIYVVSFERKGTHHDDLEIPVSFSGAPIQGKERPIDKRDMEQ